ncbi:sodium-dependent transporter [Lacipirellula parvula]|uniref:Sodium-dependent transporter n=1 Tax=Lacipirellula parvula TaxID=2650471 RepID=A0A5K7X8T9_9BACT|nr:sodium-dependent transporter [Lacipirellula parvula]BBO33214.1 sodium-dependent transporter [Lacipirellula parvula]
MSEKPGGEQWTSRMGVIMAVAGSAVGIGNYLRFPGLAVEHGGGAFMLPYFVALLVLGIPLSWAEWTMGRYGGIRGFNSAPGIYSVIWRHPAAKYFGALALMIPLIVYMYYVLIEAWCLSYAIDYLTGDLMTGHGGRIDQVIAGMDVADDGAELSSATKVAAFSKYFDEFIGAGQDGSAIFGGRGVWLVILTSVFLLNFACIYRGLSHGIEKLCNIAIPVLFVLSFAVLFRVLTLGTPDPSKPDQNLMAGLAFMWEPNEEAIAELKNPKTWLDAAGQIFFTLGVGFGIIINYSSYLRRKDDIALSSLTATSINEFSEVCHGGLITIPAAFVFLGIGGLAATNLDSTFAVGFVALPNVFDAMWGGRLFGFMWYFMLFTAAIAASVSMLQPCIAFLEEGFGLKRRASAAILGGVSAFGCVFVLYFSKGSVALDTFDFWVGTFLMFMLALVQTILYGWVLGIERGHQELHQGANLNVPYFVQYVLKYVTPTYLITVLIAFIWLKLGSQLETVGKSVVAQLSLAIIAILLGGLMVMTWSAGRRWSREGRFKGLDAIGEQRLEPGETR